MNVASLCSAVPSRNPPAGTLLDLLSILRKKNWLILKFSVGICCYSKPGPRWPASTVLSALPHVCSKWRQAVVGWEMQNSQSVCLFNVTGNISCWKWYHSALSDGRHSPTNKNLMTHFTRHSELLLMVLSICTWTCFYLKLQMVWFSIQHKRVICVCGRGWERSGVGGAPHPSTIEEGGCSKTS